MCVLFDLLELNGAQRVVGTAKARQNSLPRVCVWQNSGGQIVSGKGVEIVSKDALSHSSYRKGSGTSLAK